MEVPLTMDVSIIKIDTLLGTVTNMLTLGMRNCFFSVQRTLIDDNSL